MTLIETNDWKLNIDCAEHQLSKFYAVKYGLLLGLLLRSTVMFIAVKN